MQVIADLQLHSRFSRAVSKDMTIPAIARWAKWKGIGLVATGDWTHPLWMREIKANLEEAGNGLLKLKNQTLDAGSEKLDVEARGLRLDKANLTSNFQPQGLTSNFYHPTSPLFLLATEVSCIYTQNNKVRRVHTLIWVPTMESADKISREMTMRGCNLMSDGRPIIGLSSIHVAELVLSIEPKALIIPAHCWTPWFSLYGSMSGFDSIEEAFGPFAKNIYAVETGLSSSPSMNWRIKELDTRSIVSFSDAHSGPKLGREATVFNLEILNYEAIREAIIGNQNISKETLDDRSRKLDKKVGDSKLDEVDQTSNVQSQHPTSNFQRPTSKNSIAYTIEFYPEEGKYHYTGHRACNIRLTPEETKKKGTVCPVCGKPLTQGVMQRVEELAGRSEEELQLSVFRSQLSDSSQSVIGLSETEKQKIGKHISENRQQKTDNEIRMIGSKAFPNRPPFVMLVPLQEIIAECIGSPVTSPKTQVLYQKLTDALGGEFSVLLQTSISSITDIAGERIARGIEKVRTGDIHIDPGYDGVFGVVAIWKESEEKPLLDASKEQLMMF